MIVPWTETITKESKGKIKFEIFPAMALGGKPNELYKQVRDGVVDIVWTLPGYTAGVFPRVEAFFLAMSLPTNSILSQDFPILSEKSLPEFLSIIFFRLAGSEL